MCFQFEYLFQKVTSISSAELSINNLDASIFLVGLYELMQISSDPSKYNSWWSYREWLNVLFIIPRFVPPFRSANERSRNSEKGARK